MKFKIYVLVIHLLLCTIVVGSDYLSGEKRSDSVLFWTGETGYIHDGVEPELGMGIDNFEFRIYYTNDMNIDPNEGHNSIHLVLDGNMHNLSSVDHKYDDGAIFNLTLSAIEPGIHKYHFEAQIGDKKFRCPSGMERATFRVNSVPILSLPLQWGGALMNKTVFPEQGISSDTYTFQIVYTDADNDSPVMEPGISGIYIDDVYHPMTPANGWGPYFNNNFTDGELYQFSTKLDMGGHQHYFQFTDIYGATTTTQIYGKPWVIHGAPDLSVERGSNGEFIECYPSSPEPKDWNNITITAQIENIGGNDTHVQFGIRFELYKIMPESGIPIPLYEEYRECPNLGIGEKYPASIHFQPLDEGIYEVKVHIDENNDVLESVEYNLDELKTNNIAFRRFNVGCDLSVGIADITPHTAYNKCLMTLVTTIHNSGPSDSISPYDILIEIHLEELEETFNHYIPSYTLIEAGGKHVITINLPVRLDRKISAIHINVTVDRDNVLPESIELGSNNDNNFVSKTIMISKRHHEVVTPSFVPSITSILLSSTILILLSGAFSKKNNNH